MTAWSSALSRILHHSDGYRLWLGAILLLVLLHIVRIIVDPLNTNLDCAINLEYATLILDGRVPYLDFVDTNPPLIFYLNVPVVFIARSMRINPIPIFTVAVLIIDLLACYALWRILPKLTVESRDDVLTLIFVWLGCSLVLLYLGHFGQREHLLMITYIPFLVYRWRRWEFGLVNRIEAALLGTAAGVGLCLKPYFLIIPACVELYSLARFRDARKMLGIEIAFLLGVGGAYGVLIARLPGVARDEFLHRWIPLLVAGYGAYDTSTIVLARALAPYLAGLVVLSLLFRFGKSRFFGDLPALLLWALAGSLVVFVVQRKGYSYHLVPAMVTLALGASVVLSGAYKSCLTRLESAFRPVVGHVAPAACALVLTVSVAAYSCVRYVYRYTGGTLDSAATEFGRFVTRTTAPDDRVLIMSTSVFPAYPTLLQTGRRSASRYLYLFPIPLVFFDGRARVGRRIRQPYVAVDAVEEEKILAELTHDIAVNRPTLILIDNSGQCQGCPTGFNLFTYLTDKGFVDQAMRDYCEFTTIGGYVAFHPCEERNGGG